MKPGDKSCHQSDSHTAELQVCGRFGVPTPFSPECYCKYVTLESTCDTVYVQNVHEDFGIALGALRVMLHCGLEPWAQYCKSLNGCDHSVYYFVYCNCGQLMFPVQLWPLLSYAELLPCLVVIPPCLKLIRRTTFICIQGRVSPQVFTWYSRFYLFPTPTGFNTNGLWLRKGSKCTEGLLKMTFFLGGGSYT